MLKVLDVLVASTDVVFLQVGYESTSVESSEWVSISVDTAKNGTKPVPSLAVDIQRADLASIPILSKSPFAKSQVSMPRDAPSPSIRKLPKSR